MSCYLGLDFDGVFRGSEAHSETNFAALSSFEAVLREFPEVELVVASSRARSLVALRELFSVDLAQRVVGVAHDMPPPMGGATTTVYATKRPLNGWLTMVSLIGPGLG